MPAKIIPSKEIIEEIRRLYQSGIGAERISKQFNFSRNTIRRICKELQIYDSSRKQQALILKEKTCKICGKLKPVNLFRKREKYNLYECYCLDCEKEYCKIQNKKRYYEKWDERKQYRVNNKDKIRNYERNKIKNDPNFSLRKKVSASIRKSLKSKNMKSILDYLPYSIQELREHLENQFEPWMSWDNHGIYRVSSWDDNDQSTWKWQIDHIVPHSEFTYTSMEDDEFKKCWSLNNLRPLSAKQNVIEGARKVNILK